MKRDITERKDIKLIISNFYEKLILDEHLFPFFKEMVETGTLEHHLEGIVDFWEDILFDTQKYDRNVMQKHLNFSKKVSFKQDHFRLWLHYLTETTDHLFLGSKSDLMKTRAKSIAMVMQLKMNLYKNG